MTTLEFLQALWPDEGYYCLAFPFKHGFFHKVFDTIEDAAAHALEVRQQQDVFFCMNTLASRRVWYKDEINPKTGHPGKWCERKHENMAWAKCFFADLDVGEDTKTTKKFPTQGGAVRALKDFLDATDLPWPTINSSGRGVHIFWPLTEKLPTTEWKPYATKLKHLMRHHGLWADPTRVDDESSVLRVADTFHLKDPANPVLVQTEYTAVPACRGAFLALVDEACIRAGVETPGPLGAAAHDPVPVLSDGRRHNIADAGVFSGPPVSVDAVGRACAQVHWLVGNAADLNNSQWYQGVLQTFRHVEGGREVIDAVSAQHSDRLARVDAKLQQLEGANIGPTTCVKMEELCGTDLCRACPFFGKVKAPLAAARKVVISAPPPVVESEIIIESDDGDTEPQVITLPKVPPPWDREEGGGISRMVKGPEGDMAPRRVYDHDLYPLRLIANDGTQIMQSEWRATLPRREPLDFLMENSTIHDQRALVDKLSNAGMLVKHENLNDVRDYMIDYLQELQRYIDDSKQFSHLGWTKDHKSFIMEDKTLSAGEFKKSNLSGSARTAARDIGKEGTLERQIELMQFYNRPEWVGHQFFILCSLGSPLLYATLQRGVVVNASGESGASKSSALFAGASFWGHPELYPLNGNNRGGTPLLRAQRMATLANLPFCFDEITHMSNEDVQDMVMNATQARPQKAGLLSNSTERPTISSYKASLMLCSANSSLNEKLSVKNQAGTAGSMRVFEMFFKECDKIHKPAAHAFLGELYHNYGHIGEAFMIEYLKNQAEYERRITERILEIDATENMRVSERFWSAVMAVALVAGEIALAAGLLPYEIAPIRAWLHSYQIPSMRGNVISLYSRPIDVMADYIEKITPDILVVNKNAGNVWAPKGVRGALVARLETHAGMMWIHRQTFKEHCQRVGASMSQTIENLVISKVIVNDRIQRTLGAGVPEYAHGQTWCIQIDMNHPDMCGKKELLAVPVASQKVIPLRQT